jgi:CubicO group peptidase (beta-lactamase class C family)
MVSVAAAVLLSACAPRAEPASSPLARYIDSIATSDTFAGTIQVRRHDSVLYARSFGLAERAFNTPNGRDTRYRIASITKAFTGLLIAQLMQQGRLAPTTTIGAALPEYAGPARDVVTIQQLLHHTSGLSNMDAGLTLESALASGMPAYQRPRTLAQMVRDLASGPLVRSPGTTFDYNNGEYLILGAIIEQLYRQPLDVVLQNQVLTPLRMTSSGIAMQGRVIPQLASTYFYRPDIKQIVPDLPVYLENWGASGAMYSTADDLMRFAHGLFSDTTLLAADWRDRYLTPALDEYAFGFWSFTRDIGGTKVHVMKRPGSIMGAQTQFYHLIEPQVTVVILTNTTTMDLDAMVASIADRVLTLP